MRVNTHMAHIVGGLTQWSCSFGKPSVSFKFQWKQCWSPWRIIDHHRGSRAQKAQDTLTKTLTNEYSNSSFLCNGAHLTFEPIPYYTARVAEVWNSWCLYMCLYGHKHGVIMTKQNNTRLQHSSQCCFLSWLYSINTGDLIQTMYLVWWNIVNHLSFVINGTQPSQSILNKCECLGM